MFRYIYGFDIPAHNTMTWDVWIGLYSIAIGSCEFQVCEKAWEHFAASAMEQTDASEVYSILGDLRNWESPEATDLEIALHKHHAAKLHSHERFRTGLERKPGLMWEHLTALIGLAPKGHSESWDHEPAEV